jgi:hypothetical protein
MDDAAPALCERCRKPCFDSSAPEGFCSTLCASRAAEKQRQQARAENLAARVTAPLSAEEVCAKKRRFPDEAAAKAMAAIIGLKTGRSLEPYPCGDHWHHQSTAQHSGSTGPA